MDFNSCSIPVSLLRQHCFCPRIPFFSLVKGISPTTNQWVSQGKEFHDQMQSLVKRRSLVHFGLEEPYNFKTNVKLKSHKWPMHGICDAVLFSNDGCTPFEFKFYAQPRLSTGTIVQLTAYSMILEELFSTPVTRAFAITGPRQKPIPIEITDKRKHLTLVYLDKIIENGEKGLLPHSCATVNQCSQCEFLNFCADRL